jgi:hypothetical protein
MTGFEGFLSSILAAVQLCQTCLDDMVHVKVVFWVLNFLISSIAAYISFPVFNILTRSPDLLAGIENLDRERKKLGPVVRRFTARWSFVTGIFAAALISLQFNGLNVASAIFYGALGPFVLKDEILKKGVQRNISGMVSEADESAARIPVEAMKPYEKRLEEIKKELPQSGDS